MTMIKEESLHFIPESEEFAQAVQHDGENGGNQKSQRIQQRSRSRLFRMPSEMLKSSFHEEFKADDGGVACEVTEHRELVEREAKRRPHHLACLRKAASLRQIQRASFRRSGSRDGSIRNLIDKKVRLATNKSTNRVWCFVQEYEKEPESSKTTLWWTEAEMNARTDEDMDVVDSVEERYSPALEAAYASAKGIPQRDTQDAASTSLVDLSFSLLASCAAARGLETDVCPKIGQMVERHRKAVLKTQQLIQEKLGDGFDRVQLSDEEHKLIRLQSIKYSSASMMVARRLAAFDQQFLEQLSELEHSLYDSSEFMSEGDFSLNGDEQ